MVLELWHLPSTNMIGSWLTAEEADNELKRGLAHRDVDALDDHALVSVDDEDETRLVAEGAAIPDALRKLRLVDEMQLALERSASVRDVLVRETLAIYARTTGGAVSGDTFREQLEGYVAGRIVEGSVLVNDDEVVSVKKAG